MGHSTKFLVALKWSKPGRGTHSAIWMDGAAPAAIKLRPSTWSVGSPRSSGSPLSWIKVGIFFISFRLYVILYFAEAAHSSTNTDNWHTQEKEREGGVCVATYNAFIIFMFHVFYWQLSRVLLTLSNHGYFLTCIIGMLYWALVYVGGTNHRRLALKI